MTRRLHTICQAMLLFSLVLVAGCTSGSSLVGIPHPAQGAASVLSVPATDAGLAEHVPQQLIIRFLPGATTETILAEIKGTVLRELKKFDAAVVALPQGASIVDAIRRVQAMSGVKYAEPNYIYRALQTTPNDPFFATKQWGPQQINAPSAWGTTQGSSTSVIAIIDTGVSATHPDLTSKLLAGINTLTAPNCTTSSGVTDDDNGHGTHVAGIAAAIGNNSLGIAGISWLSSILPIKVGDLTHVPTASTVACGLNFAANFAVTTPADRVVANMSLGGAGYSQLVKDAVDLAIGDNVVVIAAAGNSGSAAVLFPAGYPGVMAVGATDPTNARASFSTYGPHLSVVAPGVDIYSTLPGATYGYQSGTSMAAPHVSGVAALVRAVNTGFTVSQVRSQIEQTATRLPAGSGGFNPQFGWGLVNAAAAVGAPVTNTYGGVQVTVTRPISSPGPVTLTFSTFGGFLPPGTYYVVVTALDAMSHESLPSPESSVVTLSTGQITVAWMAVSGAISYRVWIATTSGGETMYFPTTSTSFTITTTSGAVAGNPPSPVDVIIWNGTPTCTSLTQEVLTARTNSTGVAMFNAVPAPSGNSYCATASEANPVAKGGTTSPFTVTAGMTLAVPVPITP